MGEKNYYIYFTDKYGIWGNRRYSELPEAERRFAEFEKSDVLYAKLVRKKDKKILRIYSAKAS